MTPRYTRPGAPLLFGRDPRTGRKLRRSARLILDNFLVTGRSGSGKTQWLLALARQWGMRPRVVQVIISGKDSGLEHAYVEERIRPALLVRLTTVEGKLTVTMDPVALAKRVCGGDVRKMAGFLARQLVGTGSSDHYGQAHFYKAARRILHWALGKLGPDTTASALARLIAQRIEKEPYLLKDAGDMAASLEALAAVPVFRRQPGVEELDLEKLLTTDGAVLVAAFDLAGDPDASVAGIKLLLAALFSTQRKLYLQGRALQLIVHCDDVGEALQSGSLTTWVATVRERLCAVGFYAQELEEATRSHRGGAANFGSAVKEIVGTAFYFSVKDGRALNEALGERELVDVAVSEGETHQTDKSGQSRTTTYRRKTERGMLPFNEFLHYLRTPFTCLCVPMGSKEPPFVMRCPLPLTGASHQRLRNTPWPAGPTLSAEDQEEEGAKEAKGGGEEPGSTPPKPGRKGREAGARKTPEEVSDELARRRELRRAKKKEQQAQRNAAKLGRRQPEPEGREEVAGKESPKTGKRNAAPKRRGRQPKPSPNNPSPISDGGPTHSPPV